MADEWRDTKLGKICDFVAGSAFPKETQGESEGDYPFIKVSDMNLAGNERYIDAANNWIAEATKAKLRAKVHPPGATTFAKIGVALTYNRRRVLRQPTIIDNNMMSAVPKNGESDNLFFYYLLRTIDFNSIVVGTALPYLKVSDLKRISVRIPSLIKEQQAIACILGTLDDKIELNRRMNETLEAMAMAIFKSWFVDFDPIRAKATGQQPHGFAPHIADQFPDAFQNSDLGEIPKGWRVRSLPEVLQINPSRSLPKGSLAPYLGMADMPTKGPTPESWVLREMGSGMKFINGDTLVARITPCLENGKTAFVDFLGDGEVGWGSTEYIVLRPTGSIPPVFAYLLARTENFRTFAIQQMTGSSGRQRVPADSLGKYILPAPEIDSSLFQDFGKLVSPLFDRIKAAMEQSRTLAALRDALLPKLVSGELRVPDAERIVGRCT
jgi:type I restriction enzyme S subunit